jgi:hypothetical protein
VDVGAAGDEIVVTNGVYSTGARSMDGITTNRVAVDKPIMVRNLNGPQFTVIDDGAAEPRGEPFFALQKSNPFAGREENF